MGRTKVNFRDSMEIGAGVFCALLILGIIIFFISVEPMVLIWFLMIIVLPFVSTVAIVHGVRCYRRDE